MSWRTFALAFCAGMAAWTVSNSTDGWWQSVVVIMAVSGAYIVGCADMYAWESERGRQV